MGKNLTDVSNDLSNYKAAVAAAFKRVQIDLDNLKANQNDPAALDALDASIQDGIATAQGFDNAPPAGPGTIS